MCGGGADIFFSLHSTMHVDVEMAFTNTDANEHH